MTEKGYLVLATVKSVKGTCNVGHREGDVFQVSARDTNGMCGYLYHDAFPSILMLQFGGSFPWGEANEVEVDCPDKMNQITIELRRIA